MRARPPPETSPARRVGARRAGRRGCGLGWRWPRWVPTLARPPPTWPAKGRSGRARGSGPGLPDRAVAVGGVAQLEEPTSRTVEVAGSSPVAPTNATGSAQDPPSHRLRRRGPERVSDASVAASAHPDAQRQPGTASCGRIGVALVRGEPHDQERPAGLGGRQGRSPELGLGGLAALGHAGSLTLSVFTEKPLSFPYARIR